MTIKKRFIAGAVCPKCQAMDSIRVYRIEKVEVQECIHCDYQEQQVFETGGAPKKPETPKDQIAIRIIEP